MPIHTATTPPLLQLFQANSDCTLQGNSLDEDDEQGAALQAPSSKQLVWVLCGGEGTEADISLASGLHIHSELSKQPDLQACLRPPPGSRGAVGVANLERRSAREV